MSKKHRYSYPFPFFQYSQPSDGISLAFLSPFSLQRKQKQKSKGGGNGNSTLQKSVSSTLRNLITLPVKCLNFLLDWLTRVGIYLFRRFIRKPQRLCARLNDDGLIHLSLPLSSAGQSIYDDSEYGYAAKTAEYISSLSSEIYNNGAFGKAKLSRGLPTWHARHFDPTYKPQGLAEMRSMKEYFENKAEEGRGVQMQSLQDSEEDQLATEAQHIMSKDLIEPFILMPEEAFFLSFGLGILDLYDEKGRILGIQEMWNRFRQQSGWLPSDRHVNDLEEMDGKSMEDGIEFDFATRYAVYHHYRSQRWAPRSGLIFGFDFVLYQKGPQYRHSDYGVWIIPSNKDVPVLELTAKARVANSVKKALLLCFVDIPVNRDQYSCIQDFKISSIQLNRWSPQRDRE